MNGLGRCEWRDTTMNDEIAYRCAEPARHVVDGRVLCHGHAALEHVRIMHREDQR